MGRTACLAHDIETEDLGMAMREFPGSGLGTILGTNTYPCNAYWGIEIHGTEGGACADLSGDTKWSFLEGLEDREQQLQRVSPHRNIVEDVASAIRSGTPFACDAFVGRMSVELLPGIYASARSGGQLIKLGATDP